MERNEELKKKNNVEKICWKNTNKHFDSENCRLLLKYTSPHYKRISEDTKTEMLVRWLEQEGDIDWSWVFSPLEDELYT